MGKRFSALIKRLTVISLIFAIVICMAPFSEAKSPDGLDDYLATGLIGDGEKAEEAETEEETAEEPRLEAGAGSFAEALAQEYVPSGGTFSLSEGSRFYIAADTGGSDQKAPPKELTETVRTMASLFAAYGINGEKPMPVAYGYKDYAQSGDIIIELRDTDDFHPGIMTADLNETYTMDITADGIDIRACHPDGIWYGLTELMEMACENSKLRCCSISDGPDLYERTLMLDCGRKYFSKEWIENLIRRAALQRYNAVVLHFAEAEGIRLDSRDFPWLTENIDSLSTEEMREIVETAARYHVEIIPSFDTPGHNRFMVERYAEYVSENPDFSFEYNGKTYDSSIDGFGSIANHYSNGGETEAVDYIGIDLSKEHAVAFTNALIDSYAAFFKELGCSKIDIGSDELLGWYNFELGGERFSYDNRWSALDHWTKYARDTLGIEDGSASDVFITYINDLAERLEKQGFTTRVFNDEIDINPDQHVELRDSVEITYWFDADNTAGHFAEKGHVVHNFMESWCFYVLRKNKGEDIMDNKYSSVTASNIWENWDPRSFARKAGDEMTVPADRHGGGYFAIWCDMPDYKDSETVWSETEMKTWANASRMWNCEANSDSSGIRSAVDYDMMKAFAQNMKGFPGHTGDPETDPELTAAGEAAVSTTFMQKLAVILKND